MTTVLIFLISIVAGLLGAMTGQGGGVLLVPFLTLIMGVDVKTAIAASIVSVIATSSGSASAYVRDRLSNVKIGMYLEMFTILGALVGAAITLRSGGHIIFTIFGLVLLASFVALLLKPDMGEMANQKQDRLSAFLELEGEYYDQATGETIAYKGTRAAYGGTLMFGAGLIAGMLGIGAGALKVLIHDLIMELPPKVSTTTSNFIIGVTALAGTSAYLAAGLIKPSIAVPVIVGVTIGSRFGTRILIRMTNAAVRKFFMVVLFILGSEMILRGLGLL
ncbi:MAG: sulfite exporter TauE/SafE family protein [Bacillota bacterium]